ncbi:MAG: hypothetical protein RI885_834 [Actinomycetota bacterium]
MTDDKRDDNTGAAASEDGDTADVGGADDLIQAEDADVEVSTSDVPGGSDQPLPDAGGADSDGAEVDGAGPLSDDDLTLLAQAEQDLVGEMRTEMLRAKADLVNFRNRVERDRVATREAVIAEVIRALLPAMDDLTRAETHGDLAGSPLELVAQKIRGGFEKFGLRSVGEKGDTFDPHFHEALVQLPSPEVTVNTVADVIEPGYALGDRLVRAAKVAVHVPAE